MNLLIYFLQDEALRRAIEASIQDAMAQSQKQEQEEEDTTLDFSRGRPGSGRNQGGKEQCTMTLGEKLFQIENILPYR